MTEPTGRPRRRYFTELEMIARFDGIVHRSTWAYWRAMGQGPKWIKLGKRVAYLAESVDQWEERLRAKAGK